MSVLNTIRRVGRAVVTGGASEIPNVVSKVNPAAGRVVEGIQTGGLSEARRAISNVAKPAQAQPIQHTNASSTSGTTGTESWLDRWRSSNARRVIMGIGTGGLSEVARLPTVREILSPGSTDSELGKDVDQNKPRWVQEREDKPPIDSDEPHTRSEVLAERERERLEQREDSAIQRQVLDMQKAGINPALAFGGGSVSGAASGSVNNASNDRENSVQTIIGFLADLLIGMRDTTGSILERILPFITGGK